MAAGGIPSGSLTINGTPIATDATTTNAQALAGLINAQTVTTGVAATVTNARATLGAFSSVTTSGAGDTYTFNVGGATGLTITRTGPAAVFTAADLDAAIAAAVPIANITVSGTAAAGNLSFTKSDGTNLTITQTLAGTATGGFAGLTSGATQTMTGAVNLASSGTIAVGGTNPLAAGLETLNAIGRLSFGTGTTLLLPASPFTVAFNPPGAAPMSIAVSHAGATQNSLPFNPKEQRQNGYTAGSLTGFNISDDGKIIGRYSNGKADVMGQVTLVNFANPNGLQAMGNNQFTQTSDSGEPMIGTPGAGSAGVIQSSAVEDSNVDLTAELVNMITAQRIYQANAQTIKTEDQIMQTLVNLR